jgi:hypothetical protein
MSVMTNAFIENQYIFGSHSHHQMAYWLKTMLLNHYTIFYNYVIEMWTLEYPIIKN